MLIEIITVTELLTEATIPPTANHVLICCLNFFLVILRIINYYTDMASKWIVQLLLLRSPNTLLLPLEYYWVMPAFLSEFLVVLFIVIENSPRFFWRTETTSYSSLTLPSPLQYNIMSQIVTPTNYMNTDLKFIMVWSSNPLCFYPPLTILSCFSLMFRIFVIHPFCNTPISTI